jgi:hypothetical protein
MQLSDFVERFSNIPKARLHSLFAPMFCNATATDPPTARLTKWGIRVVLTGRRPLPVLPDHQTFSGSFGMSQKMPNSEMADASHAKKKPPEGGSPIQSF